MSSNRVTEDEYLARERRSLDKHELIHGVVVAMAGASPKHNAIALNVGAALKNRLRGRRCCVFNSDQRINIEATGLYTYADTSTTCERPQFHPKYQDNLLNPQVIVEVLSKAAEAYDRGAKFAHYQRIASLAEYVLVSQAERRVDHYRRIESGQWILTVYEGDAAIIAFPALGCEVPLSELYEDTDLLDEAGESE
ncbi:MAG: Uma2 family endonuclease [Minicystis sp.]